MDGQVEVRRSVARVVFITGPLGVWRGFACIFGSAYDWVPHGGMGAHVHADTGDVCGDIGWRACDGRLRAWTAYHLLGMASASPHQIPAEPPSQ